MRKYRCVLILQYATGPVVTANEPTTQAEALRQFRFMVASGAYGPHNNRRVQVMADADYRHTLGVRR